MVVGVTAVINSPGRPSFDPPSLPVTPRGGGLIGSADMAFILTYQPTV